MGLGLLSKKNPLLCQKVAAGRLSSCRSQLLTHLKGDMKHPVAAFAAVVQ